jgi:hypothetical protein
VNKGIKMKKPDKKSIQNPSLSAAPRWERSKKVMTEEEVEKFKNMNWEWYYNCYLYLDEPLEILCKICGGLNIFQPREMKKKCEHCGIECHRCEMKEEIDTKSFQPKK